jgi:cytochrome c oxidase subunit III
MSKAAASTATTSTSTHAAAEHAPEHGAHDAHAAHDDDRGHDEPHLPHGSIWPIWVAVAVSLVGLGFVFLDGTSIWLALGGVTLQVPLLLLGGIAMLVYVVFFGWVREDIHWWNDNVGTGPGIAKAGTLLFISSEVFIFGALFSTYFTFQRLADHWPDVDVHLPIVKTGIFSLFLFSSSYTIHQAEKLLKAGNRKGFQNWWLATIVLGAIFLAGQVWEYVTLVQEGHGLTGSQFMTTFYMLTGTHGLHVFGGLLFLIVVYVRSLKGQQDEKRHVAMETSAIYWHFVDIVWVIVFTVLYIVPAYFLGGGHA